MVLNNGFEIASGPCRNHLMFKVMTKVIWPAGYAEDVLEEAVWRSLSAPSIWRTTPWRMAAGVDA